MALALSSHGPSRKFLLVANMRSRSSRISRNTRAFSCKTCKLFFLSSKYFIISTIERYHLDLLVSLYDPVSEHRANISQSLSRQINQIKLECFNSSKLLSSLHKQSPCPDDVTNMIEMDVSGSLQCWQSDDHDVTVEVPRLLVNVINRLAQYCPGLSDTGLVLTVPSSCIVLQRSSH